MPTTRSQTRRRAIILDHLQRTCFNDADPLTRSSWTELVRDETFDLGPASRFAIFNTRCQDQERGHCYTTQQLFRYMNAQVFREPLDPLTRRPLQAYERYLIMRQYSEYLYFRRFRDPAEQAEWLELHAIVETLEGDFRRLGLQPRVVILVLYQYGERALRFRNTRHRPWLNIPSKYLRLLLTRLSAALRAHPDRVRILRQHLNGCDAELGRGNNALAGQHAARAVVEVGRLLNATP